MHKILITSVAALLLATGAASAHTDCFVVKKTPDGFLALREKPTTKSKIIATLRMNFPLQTNGSDPLEGHEYRLYKNWTQWTYVNAWMSEDEAHPERGWFYSRYIKKVLCDFEDKPESKPATQYPSWLGIRP
jgi:hypothetical protein